MDIWKIVSFVVGLVVLVLVLKWIGVDMQSFQNLWDTMMQCLNDILSATKNIAS